MTRGPIVTLLFVHGGGLCKDCWDPIIRRLKGSPLLAGRAQFVAFDFSWHGSNYDHSVAADVDRSNPDKPRVDHPARDIVTWAPQEVWQQVQKLRAGQRARGESDKTPLIGIGHSMGAMALWKTEITHPGTFAGLTLFEPGYGIRTSENDYTVDFLVALALQREVTWPTRLAAQNYFENLRNFARWDREALAAYLRGALVEQDDGSVLLACHPLIEASLYCHTPLYLATELQKRPQCRINFQGGGRSKVYNGKAFEDMATNHPHIYRTRPLMPGLSHVMVLEDPAECAHMVLEDLKELVPAGDTPPQSRM
ncbi:hypothetical protein PHYBOEH_010655 [Phytophthora boehmeriae]|uniref:AB hydrolase-1 domain-containing protein n=1 Tax=Phytophthora boehmeriae TaxID=109152 RepID=A0A8T1WYN8_9STRA|nr:hypothetical protein PHYBOEH_010655 [Phytophthora boehmeriae]